MKKNFPLLKNALELTVIILTFATYSLPLGVAIAIIMILCLLDNEDDHDTNAKL